MSELNYKPVPMQRGHMTQVKEIGTAKTFDLYICSDKGIPRNAMCFWLGF